MTILNGRNNSIGKYVIYSCILFACLACTIYISSLGYKKTVERNYDIEKKIYENLGKVDDGESNVDITYPYIVNELNSDAYSKVNDLILEEILEHCEIDICSYKIGYEIKHKDENYLSILFQGMQVPLGSAHPSDIAWGLTFDMKTGSVLSITDFVQMPDLQRKIEQREFEEIRGIDITVYESVMGEVEWFQEYEELSLDCNDEDHQNDFYLAENKLGILFGVSHAVGDYIIIEMDK